ncbi:TOBE domain-containing protein [Oceanimonas doudoroffii]|uniref:Molybdenum-dependent transcriptional regulator n=1 Tax=Oceanimonas doudoroffii TaxID=84158 RepID=A0A233RI23_9GAMM|nr:TOBE domain-containing protein [Oceanimonas doudoroffii]OXY83037.1 molybdenum-dependent transcriptional regulator [Oceanimonas doudoroffii]
MELDILLSLQQQGRLFISPKRVRLLECIREQGSISRGAQAAGISYKSAWDAVKDMNTLAGQPLVASETGGKGGGGARLTPYGERLLKIYALLGRIERMAVNALQDESASLDSLLAVVSRFGLQTSARNQFFAQVTSVGRRDLSHQVGLRLNGGATLLADITERSCRRLGLIPGKEVLALIKAPWVTIETGSGKTPNRLAGTVSAVMAGDRFNEVMLTLDQGGEICALRPIHETLPALGARAFACFAPEQVILATLEP